MCARFVAPSLFLPGHRCTRPGRLKLRTLRDRRGAVPVVDYSSDGKLHDVNLLDLLIFGAGAFCVKHLQEVASARALACGKTPMTRRAELPRVWRHVKIGRKSGPVHQRGGVRRQLQAERAEPARPTPQGIDRQAKARTRLAQAGPSNARPETSLYRPLVHVCAPVRGADFHGALHSSGH